MSEYVASNYGTVPEVTPDEKEEAMASGWIDAPKPESEAGEIRPEIRQLGETVVALGEETVQLREQVKQHEDAALKADALKMVIDSYEAGKHSAAYLADSVLETLGEDAAAEFASYWHAQEGDEPDPYGEEPTPSEWFQQARQRMADGDMIEQAIRDAEARGKAELQVEERLTAALAEQEKFLAEFPDATRHEAAIRGLLTEAYPGGVPPEVTGEALRSAYRTVNETAAIESGVSELFDEFDEQTNIERAFRGEAPLTPEERQASKVAAVAGSIRMSKIPSHDAKIAAAERQLDEDLFGKERVMADGWNFGKVSEGAQKLAVYAEKKQLPVSDPQIVQYARKKNWI